MGEATPRTQERTPAPTMPRRAPRHQTGRPSRLTPDRADRITAMVEDHVPIVTACAVEGISQTAFYQWLEAARDAREAILRGEPVAPQARTYVAFAEALQRAQARAETSAVAVVKKVMDGGYLISRKPALSGDGLPVYDRGELVYEEVYAQPDGKLAMEYLARRYVQRWGRNPEPTAHDPLDPAGGPAAVLGSDSQAAVLAERFAAFAAQRDEERVAIESGVDDVVDAEVVDD